jgi:cytoskeleton protein RodZ
MGVGPTFPIGSSLREARKRRELQLQDAAHATRIRAKYLAALEAERFEELPAEVYARAFLRTYAEFLGLDGQLYLDEYNARFATAEEPSVAPPPPRRPRGWRLESKFVVVTIAGIVAVTVLVVVALAGLGGESDPSTGPIFADPPPTATTETGRQPVARAKKEPAAPSARLVLAAARGDCWLIIRLASRNGRVLYEGLLAEGETLRVTGRRLWVRMGAPWNLEARLNGRALRDLPADTGNVIVTRAGLKQA